MTIKRILMAGILMTFLSGCALLERRPTPEELFDEVAEIDLSGYVSLELEGKLMIETDEAEYGQEGNAVLEFTGDALHRQENDVKLTTPVAAVDNMCVETWEDDKYCYSQLTLDDESMGWAYAEKESEEYQDVDHLKDVLEDISSDLFDDLTLKDTERRENYIVNGTMEGGLLLELVGDIFIENAVSELMPEDPDDLAKDLIFDIEAEFDYQTRQLLTIEIKLNEKDSDFPKDINDLEAELQLTFHEVDPKSDKELEIPEDVTEEAVEVQDWENDLLEQLVEDTDQNESVEGPDLIGALKENILIFDAEAEVHTMDVGECQILTYSYNNTDDHISMEFMFTYTPTTEEARAIYDDLYSLYEMDYENYILHPELNAVQFYSEEEDEVVDLMVYEDLLIQCSAYNNGDKDAKEFYQEIDDVFNQIFIIR